MTTKTSSVTGTKTVTHIPLKDHVAVTSPGLMTKMKRILKSKQMQE